MMGRSLANLGAPQVYVQAEIAQIIGIAEDRLHELANRHRLPFFSNSEQGLFIEGCDLPIWRGLARHYWGHAN